jgi:hypothetical protein
VDGIDRRHVAVRLVEVYVEAEGETVTIRCWAGGEDDEM